MKTNYFKYIFALFVIVIAIFAVYKIYFKEEDKQNEIQENVVEEETKIKDLRLGISNFDTMNPLISSNREVLNIGKLIFEPLIEISEDYKTKLCLATECSKTSPTTYVIKIDNNKKWHDGSSLIAKDIQFTIDRLKEGKSIYSYNVEKVISVEVLDASTVKITLSEEVPFFEYNLTFPIMPNNYYLSEDFYTSSKIPQGTGMYKISQIDSSYIVLEKNNKWWNIKAKDAMIEKIYIKQFSEVGELYNSFKLGNIDIFTTENENLEQYIGTIGYSSTQVSSREFDYLAFNCQNAILQDSKIRKAINYAIDKTNILSSIYNNQGNVAEFPLDYGNYLYTREANSLGYNPEQSKKILEESGWEYKNNRWQKTENHKTKRLRFTLTVNSENIKRVATAENIKNQLEEIGIKVTIQKVSNSRYKEILENKNYEMILTGVYNSYSPDITAFFEEGNLQNYTNNEVKDILNQVKNIKDEQTLKEKYKRLIEIFLEEQPFIGIRRGRTTIVKSQKLSGEIKANNYFGYYGIENWHRI
jgi:extracellular solute-binding protein family 5